MGDNLLPEARPYYKALSSLRHLCRITVGRPFANPDPAPPLLSVHKHHVEVTVRGATTSQCITAVALAQVKTAEIEKVVRNLAGTTDAVAITRLGGIGTPENLDAVLDLIKTCQLAGTPNVERTSTSSESRALTSSLMDDGVIVEYVFDFKAADIYVLPANQRVTQRQLFRALRQILSTFQMPVAELPPPGKQQQLFGRAIAGGSSSFSPSKPPGRKQSM